MEGSEWAAHKTPFHQPTVPANVLIGVAGGIKVIRGFGYLLNCRDMDLPSPAGNTNNPLKAVIVWPPILPSSNSQASRSCKSDE
jgi:hypothetical protein